MFILFKTLSLQWQYTLSDGAETFRWNKYGEPFQDVPSRWLRLADNSCVVLFRSEGAAADNHAQRAICEHYGMAQDTAHGCLKTSPPTPRPSTPPPPEPQEEGIFLHQHTRWFLLLLSTLPKFAVENLHSACSE